jgi:adenylate kinase family enzyme
MSSQTPLPADFLEQPWVQRYLNETKGLLSVLTLENMAARWELERTKPAEAKAQAKARAERSPAAQARRRKREAAQRHQARLARQRAKEAVRLEQLEAECHRKQIQAEEKVAAEVALAAAASAAAARELAQKEAAAAHQRKSEEQQISATMIQKVYRGKSHRAQHEALLQTPIAVVSIIGGPGSGKTTFCKQLVADESLRRAGVSLCHLSIGSLLRKVAKPLSNGMQHPHAEMIRVMMEGGELVPNYIVCDILQKEITKVRYRVGHDAASQTALPINLVVLDGFPINVEQANMLDKTPLATVRFPTCQYMAVALLPLAINDACPCMCAA